MFARSAIWTLINENTKERNTLYIYIPHARFSIIRMNFEFFHFDHQIVLLSQRTSLTAHFVFAEGSKNFWVTCRKQTRGIVHSITVCSSTIHFPYAFAYMPISITLCGFHIILHALVLGQNCDMHEGLAVYLENNHSSQTVHHLKYFYTR